MQKTCANLRVTRLGEVSKHLGPFLKIQEDFGREKVTKNGNILGTFFLKIIYFLFRQLQSIMCWHLKVSKMAWGLAFLRLATVLATFYSWMNFLILLVTLSNLPHANITSSSFQTKIKLAMILVILFCFLSHTWVFNKPTLRR